MAGFWAGFGPQFTQDVNKIRDDIRKTNVTRRDHLRTNAPRLVADAEEGAEEVLTKINRMVAMGIDKRALLGVYEKGDVFSINELYDELEARPNIKPDRLRMISETAADWAGDADIDIKDAIYRSFNLYHDPDAAPDESDRGNIIQAIMTGGLSDDDYLDEAYVGAYTGRDINRLMGGRSRNTGSGSVDLSEQLGPKPLSSARESQNRADLFSLFKERIEARQGEIDVRDNGYSKILNSEQGYSQTEIFDRLSAANIGRSLTNYERTFVNSNNSATGYANYIEAISELKRLDAVTSNNFTSFATRNYQMPDMVTYALDYDPYLFAYMSEQEEDFGGAYTQNPRTSSMNAALKTYKDRLAVQGLSFDTEEDAILAINNRNEGGYVVIDDVIKYVTPDV